MRNYWTCSKFADWLRGTPKIKMGTGKEWADWEKQARVAHPIRYWIADTALDRLQDIWMFIPDRLHAIKYYINNRWVTRTHALTAHPRDIKPGQWMDVGYRFLPCLFNELVEFVEVELAWWQIAWADQAEKKKYRAPFWATGWFRWRIWRCRQAGLDNLAWQMTCTNEEFLDEDKKHLAEPTHQAIAAKEILELYTWWTEVYPKRPDPMDASGWSDYCEMRREKGYALLDLDAKSPEEEEMRDAALKKTREIEEAYEKEDEEMLIRLIKIRNSLWT